MCLRIKSSLKILFLRVSFLNMFHFEVLFYGYLVFIFAFLIVKLLCVNQISFR